MKRFRFWLAKKIYPDFDRYFSGIQMLDIFGWPKKSRYNRIVRRKVERFFDLDLMK